MKKFFMTGILLSGFLFLLCSGCSEVKNNVDDNNSNQITVPIEEVTEMVITEPPEVKIITPVKEVYVYDSSKILSDKDFTECNNYSGWINKNLMLNTAVVITDKLDDMEPSEYAKKCFEDIFKDDIENGINNGILLLINNDTNKDYIYKHGNISSYIDEKTEKEYFFYATKSIVSGDFKSAINQLLSLSELCPKYVFDNALLFSNDQITELESILDENSELNISVFTYDSIENNNILDIYKRHCDNNKGTMIFINKNSNKVSLVNDGKISDGGNAEHNNYYETLKKHLQSLGISFTSEQTDVNTTISDT